MNKQKRTSLLSGLALLAVTVIWGSSFVTQKIATDYVEPYTLMASRGILASITLGIIVLFRNLFAKVKTEKTSIKYRHGKFTTVSAGIICGLAFAAATTLQQMGIHYNSVVAKIDTAGRASFLTALYIIIVPFASFFLSKLGMLKKSLSPLIWVATVLCIGGTYFLCSMSEGGFTLGDLMLIGCAIAFTVHIFIIDMLCCHFDPIYISLFQFITTFAVTIPLALIFETPTVENILHALPSMLYLGVLGSALAYTVQIAAQKNLHPAVASLIMCFESFLATVAGAIFLHEKMTTVQYLACTAIFIGILIAELGQVLPTSFGKKSSK